MLGRSFQRGFSIIELMIVVAILAVMLAAGLPAMFQFLQSSQIRTSADTMMSGIALARAEALRTNAPVRFTLVDDITGDCSQLSTGGSWVVSLQSPQNLCTAAPDPATPPGIVQTRSFREGTQNVEVIASGGAGGNFALVFDGLGRPLASNADAFTDIDVSNPEGGVCEHVATTGKMRCLRIRVTPGGATRMCDPKVTDVADPRKC